eukprot:scaffold172433_cov30-Prasinocladus_malaysianus.AAC.1
MDSLDYTGSGIDLSKLESMELPAELTALTGGSQELMQSLGQFMGQGVNQAIGGDLNRQNSGLESMQSIEHALPNLPQ